SHAEQRAWWHGDATINGQADEQPIWVTPCIVLDQSTDAVEVKHHFRDQHSGIVLDMFVARKDAGRLLTLAGC
ncbi:MAG: hypothetical protein N2C14_21690, partial [Planctomycetales bacterium]